MDKTSEEVLQVRDNEQKLERFIARHQAFTRRCASKVTKHHVSRDDEEASVALIAFYEAIQAYEKDKGSFLPFAAMVIRRRLLDLGDKNARYAREIPSSQEALDGQFSNEETPQATADNLTAASSASQSVAIHAREEEKRSLKEEIAEIQQMLEPYGFSFFDLTECSPKAGKTKTACIQAVNAIKNHPDMIRQIRQTRTLPMKELEQLSGVKRKILDRHRRYLIAVMEIICGDYPQIRDYLKDYLGGTEQ